MKLVELQDQGLANVVDSEVVPFAPGSIVSELFLFVFAVYRFDFFELLHKLKVNGSDLRSRLELWNSQSSSFWNLDVDSYQEVAEEFDV